MTSAAASEPTSKFSSAPTIADYGRHKGWMDEVKGQLKEQGKDALAQQLPDPSQVPVQLQTFSNRYSLKPTVEESELQQKVQGMPRAMMAGGLDEANFLCMLLEMMKAQVVVEVGVFRGVTTLALAQCLQKINNTSNARTPTVIGLDVSADFAQIGQEYWKKAGVDDLIDLRIGDAKESLSTLLTEQGEAFVDMCFVDADKESYDDYYEKCVQLTKPGGLIVVDNTLWGGRVVLPADIVDTLAAHTKEDTSDAAMLARKMHDTKCIQQLAHKIHNDSRIDRVSFLTIADGVTICRKK
ncbi:Caffeoyl-CoA O-methyltransferase [Seminavis robusta]|uniref:Caffeoyl-CoA O-methyltransferase n=1 Tax=Seminavis robusta TaxID=568900 RepID=A0A9N8HPI3_9STRA|nr:Caffeoyl-CoA O-methyltransferase [Seminavis robusta]|eukprot:Sro1331_g263540.1 Caffeoyl-CoA O-methyltransferase (297) ;mRNA; f:26239-27129